MDIKYTDRATKELREMCLGSPPGIHISIMSPPLFQALCKSKAIPMFGPVTMPIGSETKAEAEVEAEAETETGASMKRRWFSELVMPILRDRSTAMARLNSLLLGMLPIRQTFFNGTSDKCQAWILCDPSHPSPALVQAAIRLSNDFLVFAQAHILVALTHSNKSFDCKSCETSISVKKQFAKAVPVSAASSARHTKHHIQKMAENLPCLQATVQMILSNKEKDFVQLFQVLSAFQAEMQVHLSMEMLQGMMKHWTREIQLKKYAWVLELMRRVYENQVPELRFVSISPIRDDSSNVTMFLSHNPIFLLPSKFQILFAFSKEATKDNNLFSGTVSASMHQELTAKAVNVDWDKTKAWAVSEKQTHEEKLMGIILGKNRSGNMRDSMTLDTEAPLLARLSKDPSCESACESFVVNGQVGLTVRDDALVKMMTKAMDVYRDVLQCICITLRGTYLQVRSVSLSWPSFLSLTISGPCMNHTAMMQPLLSCTSQRSIPLSDWQGLVLNFHHMNHQPMVMCGLSTGTVASDKRLGLLQDMFETCLEKQPVFSDMMLLSILKSSMPQSLLWTEPVTIHFQPVQVFVIWGD